MRIVISHHAFAAFAGTETYMQTIALELQRLGHDVCVYAEETGPMATVSRELGVRVIGSRDELPAACDALLAQDAGTALALAPRYPDARRVFVAHSKHFPLQIPPQLDGVSQAIVVLNDRVQRFVEDLAFHAPVVRLRQPIDLRRFVPDGVASARARRALLLGNYVQGPTLQRLRAACEQAGVELVLAGVLSEPTATPEHTIRNVDVVFGLGRCVVEAMACGRAAYVYGLAGGDGWMTPDRYPMLEADGFAGTALPESIDGDRLAADLRAWDAEMQDANRHLAMTHHNVKRHAQELVELIRSLDAGAGPPPMPADELARLVRLEWQTSGLYHGALAETRGLRQRLEEQAVTDDQQRSRLDDQRRILDQQEPLLAEQAQEIRRLSDIRAELTGALQRAEQQRADALAALEHVRNLRRNRIVRAVLAPFDALRRRRR